VDITSLRLYPNLTPARSTCLSSTPAFGDQLVVPRPQDYEFFKKNVLEILEGQREARA